MKKLKNIFKNAKFVAVEAVKGVVPGGSSVVKVIEHFTKKDLATGENIDRPTDWLAVTVRLAGLAVLLYLVLAGHLPVTELVDFLKGII